MRWIAESKAPDALRFVITPDKQAGFYVYVYKEGRMIRDYLQDTLEKARQFAWEKFHVPPDAWMAVDQPARWTAEANSMRFVIKNDLVMGFYLLAYRQDTRMDKPVQERYWPTLDQVMDFASAQYHVPLSAWKQMD